MPRRLGPLEITLIVIDVILIGVLVALLVTAPDGPDDAVPDDDGTTSAAVEGTSAQSESPSADPVVEVPDGALQVAEFATPSGNIWCSITEDAATCEIADFDYDTPSVEGCEDQDLAGRVLTVTADGVAWVCPSGGIGGADPGDRQVLDYGEATAVGDYLCSSAETGVTCTNIFTGEEFSMARANAGAA